jgi:hypothetical protein
MGCLGLTQGIEFSCEPDGVAFLARAACRQRWLNDEPPYALAAAGLAHGA